jgi:activator of HSP90 ATPase
MSTKTIQQVAHFEGVSPDELFDIFQDAEKHSALIGAKVIIDQTAGGGFTRFDGAVTGKNLLIIPKRLTVRAWRGNAWKESDLDSIEIMIFNELPGGAHIELVHSVLPEQFQDRWNELYWEPLRDYLKKRASRQ